MAISRKGMRRITVDGVAYFWSAVGERITIVIALLVAACGADSSRRVETAPATAGGSANTATTRECFCFSWVHLDENGESCFETKPECDTEFQAFGRTTKIPCSSAQHVTCGSHACRNVGQECSQL